MTTSTNVWLPIETIPRDGTWVAICRAGEPDSVETASYTGPSPDVHFEHVEGDLFRRVVTTPEPDAWNSWSGCLNMHRATHWCALPPVPEAPA